MRGAVEYSTSHIHAYGLAKLNGSNEWAVIAKMQAAGARAERSRVSGRGALKHMALQHLTV